MRSKASGSSTNAAASKVPAPLKGSESCTKNRWKRLAGFNTRAESVQRLTRALALFDGDVVPAVVGDGQRAKSYQRAAHDRMLVRKLHASIGHERADEEDVEETDGLAFGLFHRRRMGGATARSRGSASEPLYGFGRVSLDFLMTASNANPSSSMMAIRVSGFMSPRDAAQAALRI